MVVLFCLSKKRQYKENPWTADFLSKDPLFYVKGVFLSYLVTPVFTLSEAAFVLLSMLSKLAAAA